MKILVLASTYPRAADDTTPGFVHELCRRLATRGHEVQVVTPHLPASAEVQTLDGVEVRRFRYAPATLETLAGQGGIVSRLRTAPWRLLLVPVFLFAYAHAIWRASRRTQFDVVHAHWLIPQGLLAALMAPLTGRTPLICTSHGGDLFALRATGFRLLRRLIIRRASLVTVVSQYMREVLVAEGIAASKIAVASMGVDLQERFVPQPGVERDPWHLLFVGRLVEKKGVRVLIEAFPALLASHPRAHLTIVGDGPERIALEAQVAALGLQSAVRFLGARPPAALPAIYSSAAVAVVPSVIDAVGDQEGLGLVTLEAIGCGCAVVASDLRAIRDVVQDDVTGLLFRAGDVSALTTTLRRLLDRDSLRCKLSVDARGHVIKTYDWSAVTTRYEQLFQRICAPCT